MLPLPPAANASAVAAAMLGQSTSPGMQMVSSSPPLGLFGGGGSLMGMPSLHRSSSSGTGTGMTPFVAVAVTIPKKFLGHVIGKGGKYFNAIRQALGVDLKVWHGDLVVLGWGWCSVIGYYG